MTDRKGDGILEKMARAMTVAADQDTGGWIVDDLHGLKSVRIDGTVDMLAVARAALMAMREPSEDFMRAMYPNPTGEAIVAPHVAGERSRRQGRLQIARFVDAILAEGGE